MGILAFFPDYYFHSVPGCRRKSRKGHAEVKKGVLTGYLVGVLVGAAAVWWGHQQINAQCADKSDRMTQIMMCESNPGL